jgi:ferric-dicitrate binding protein FerR (iron transport regulator)
METKTNLEKWIEGSLSPEEQKEFEASSEFQEVSELITEAKKYRAPSIDVEAGYERLHEKLTSKKAARTIKLGRNQYLAIAASLALLIAATLTIIRFSQEENVFVGPTTAYLPDSTKVILHKATRLSYVEESWDNNRSVELDGEAFFDVKKGSKFTVNSSGGTVSVLGTEFNVKSRSYEFRVECFEGKVSVETNDENTFLTAGQGVYVDENNTLSSLALVDSKPGWIAGITKFKSELLSKVLKELEIIYEIEINEKNMDTTAAFTGSLPNDDLEKALEILTASTKSSYSIEGDRVILDAAKAD